MYRLPYSKNDNPNGWIEVTSHCNMRCEGCYKGIDRTDCIPVHEPIEKIKSDILSLKNIRNCGIITITGGEAIMHPDIEEIVSFVHSNKLKSLIHTNGLFVNEKTCARLKNAGLSGFIIRIDIHNRLNYKNESELNALRKKYADIVHKVGGLQLGFTCVVTKNNLIQIPNVVQWFQQNNAYTDYLVLILKREFSFDSYTPDVSKEVEVTELAHTLKNAFPDMLFSSYLGSQSSNIGYKWVQTAWFAINGKTLGYVDAKTVEFSTALGHFRNKTYSYISGKERNKLPVMQLIAGSLFLPALKPVLKRYVAEILKKPSTALQSINHQVINIVNPPSSRTSYTDYCDGCPDAVLHNGKLVPSCTLESFLKNQPK